MIEKKENLLLSNRDLTPTTEKASGKCEFALFFDEKARELELKRREIAEWLGIDYERFRKIVNRTNPTKKRDCIIACGFALWLSSSETNIALKKYGFPQLDTELNREAFISKLLEEQGDKHRSLTDINLCLRKMGMQRLDIIDHRNKKKAVDEPRIPSRYVDRGTHVECRLDEQVFGDQYNSLATEYSPTRYRVIAKKRLTDSQTGQDFDLIVDPDEHCLRIDHPITSQECYRNYMSLEQTGDLCPYFESLLNHAQLELVRNAKLLNDTRNYRERISACVRDNCLHVFTETFNYSIPELQEFFLMDYVDGVFHFSISLKSRFMELYLPLEEYTKYYGQPTESLIGSFASEKEVLDAINSEQNYTMQACKRQYLNAYRQLKNKIIEFAKRLNNDIYIVNPDIIADNGIDLDKYFCLPDEKPEWLEYGDLRNGFMLGLRTLKEIKDFKDEHGYLDIRKEFQKWD